MVDRKLNYKTQPQLKNINPNISEHSSLKKPYTRVYGKRWIDDKNITKLMHKITIKTNTPSTTKHIVDPQKTINTNTLMHPPLESPHTRVCGMRRVSNKTNNNSNTKTKPKSTNTLKTNTFTNLRISNVAIPNTKTIRHNPNFNVCININHIKSTYKQLTCPTTHKYAPINIKIKISKLDRTHMYMHKERNNNTNTTHRLNTKTQDHGPYTKNNDKDLLKHPNIYIKKPIKHISRNKHSSQHSNPLTQTMSTKYVSLSTSPSKQKAYQNKHKDHIEHTNQRKTNQHYIDTNYNTKHNLKSNTKDLFKHPNTYIKKPIPHTNIRRTNHIQHQLKHIDDLTKTHIIESKLVHTYLSTYKRKKSNTILRSGTTQILTIKKTITLTNYGPKNKTLSKLTINTSRKHERSNMKTSTNKTIETSHLNLISIKKQTLAHSISITYKHIKTKPNTYMNKTSYPTIPNPHTFSPPTHKYGVYCKHKDHIENTNQRKINQNYMDTNYKNNKTKKNLKPKDLFKHPNTHIKKPIPHTNLNRANYIQHQSKHIDDLTKPHILESKLVRPHSSTYKGNKRNTILGRGTIKNQMTNPLATKKHKHKHMKPNKNISNPISPYIYGKNIKTSLITHSACQNKDHKKHTNQEIIIHSYTKLISKTQKYQTQKHESLIFWASPFATFIYVYGQKNTHINHVKT